MGIIIKKGKNENEFLAYDSENNFLGKGGAYPFIASDLYENKRHNIYINIDVEESKNKDEIKDHIFDKLLERAYSIKEENKDLETKVYHCCFSNDKENIDYYSSKEGFVHDEGMHILRNTMTNLNYKIDPIDNIEITEWPLATEEEILKFIHVHKTVFTPGYSIEEVLDFQKKTGWHNIAATCNGEIIGDIMVYVIEDDNKKIGWVEDLLVCKSWRKKGIGKLLIGKALEYFNKIKVDESRLEVWSANDRAPSLYKKLGYEFYKETESSIGKFI
ncbi:GNAT family N-acetyltransferase [Oceanirhabdus sp. W0125-5]|uniref:GNAT family N-acetyltransferase n=1 Tax=Oceanirhabdus sp. W0125-5 TaxID=2999116 RepID=UPI0022F34874|nr:GNAT family N-acetyltransferase [Oceanirhabdus sp. W0125-5]WBW98392.1 GNAT family N-acetyltransferase [Oceanirhabdus sp. W0125-5]